MKFFSLFCLVAGFAFAGCGKQDAPASAPAGTSSGNPITAPVDYLGATAKGQKTAQGGTALVSLQQAIKLYQAQEGKLPKSLNDLVGPDYLTRLPAPPAGMKFDYHPATGDVRVAPQ